MNAGRPRLEVDEQLILSLRAKGWGYRRIAKAHSEESGYVSPSTIRNIIKASGDVSKMSPFAKSGEQSTTE
jgi:intein-encoded DNA endonuclease-like protein